ncbi:MAG: WD repeat and HMG-box DNA binding-domain containing protein 1 [Paramarteilia canceri]
MLEQISDNNLTHNQNFATTSSPIKYHNKSKKIQNLSDDSEIDCEKENRPKRYKKDVNRRRKRYDIDKINGSYDSIYTFEDEKYSQLNDVSQDQPIVPKMPNSTVFIQNSQDKRFLDFNLDGYIELSNSVGEDGNTVSSLYIKFHEANFHPNIHLENKFNYSIGRLSKKALVLVGSDENNQHIYCNLFDSWTNTKTWAQSFQKIDDLNDIILLSTSKSYIFLASSDSKIHALNYAGHQIGLYIFNKNLLQISSFEPENSEVCHLALISEGLELQILSFKNMTFELLCSSSLPLTNDLIWSSFSQNGLLSVADNLGYVGVFNHFNSTWIPLKTNDQKGLFWPISLNINKQTIYGINCEKLLGQPNVNPLPIVEKQKFSMKELFLDLSHRDEIQRAVLNQNIGNILESLKQPSSKPSQTMVKELAKMFDESLIDNHYAALEIVKLMPTLEAKKVCLKYAVKKSFSILSEKIEAILELGTKNKDNSLDD